jgi:type I restriction enzyme S subunit
MKWTKTKLGDFAPFVYGKGLPQTKRIPGNVPVYGSNGIVGMHSKSLVSQPAVIIGRKGSVGEVHLANGPSWPIDTAFFTIGSKDVDLHFLYYLLKNLPIASNSDSAVPGLNRDFAHSLQIRVPDIRGQIAIGKILSLLDEKIAANNSLSKILEDIAQTIFKSWFIDFDPVKAKMAGEKPVGMDAATAALFPDAMEESALGLIPKGWSWITVGDIATVIDCLHAKKPELLEQGYPYLQLDTISDSGVLRFENAGLISKEDYVKWTSRIEVQGGDCLITNVGRVGAVSQVPEHFKAAIGRNITAIRAKDPLLQRSFLIVALLSDFMKKEIKRNTDSGTILEALNVKNIPKLIIPGPSDAVLLEFAKLCDPLQLQIQELYSMSVNLKKIRDSLLPRLISGELQIPEEMLAS